MLRYGQPSMRSVCQGRPRRRVPGGTTVAGACAPAPSAAGSAAAVPVIATRTMGRRARQLLVQYRGCQNFTTKLSRTTLGTGLARILARTLEEDRLVFDGGGEGSTRPEEHHLRGSFQLYLDIVMNGEHPTSCAFTAIRAKEG